LSDVKYVDTTLLNALIRIRNRSFADRSDGSIRLVAQPSNNVRKLLEITRFADIFPTFDTLGDARRGIVFTSSRARSRP
jgi:anti-anti-sigma regulatory factor